MGNIYEFFKFHQFLGPVAALVGHLIVITIQNIASCLRNLDGDFYTQGVVTAFLAGAYIYSWSLDNPHSAIPRKNTPFFEVALMLASGQYASSIFSSTSCYETAYSIIGLMTMTGTLSEDIGANVITTYMFMVEIATFFFQMRDWAVRCHHPLKLFTDVLYPVVIVVARIIGLWHLTVMMLFQEVIPFIHRIEVLALTLISTYFASETLQRMGGCQRPLPRSTRKKRRTTRVRSVRRTRSSSGVTPRSFIRTGSVICRSNSKTSFSFLTSSSRIRC